MKIRFNQKKFADYQESKKEKKAYLRYAGNIEAVKKSLEPKKWYKVKKVRYKNGKNKYLLEGLEFLGYMPEEWFDESLVSILIPS